MSADLDAAVVGKAYADDLEADGGNAPLSWKVAGLPPGLEVTDGGELRGTPTAAGTFTLEVTVTDADGDVARATLQLNVRKADAVPQDGGHGGAGGHAGNGGNGGNDGDAGVPPPPDGTPVQARGGCTFGGSPASWWSLLVVALLRRRRQGVTTTRR